MRHANLDPALLYAHALWATPLNEGVAASEAGNAAAALAPLSQAITISSRFHPLFHFVESRLHTRRAVMRANAGNVAGAAEDITRALFLDHINAPMLAAKKQLDAGVPITVDAAAYDSAPRDLEEWLGSSLRGGNADVAIQPSHNVEGLDCFASLAMTKESMFDIIEAAQDEMSFARAIELVDETHREYHKLAALPWLWRAKVFAALGEAELAKNDWRRGWDLDPTIPALECHPVA